MAKVAMEVEVQIAANSTNENVVRDQQYQSAPFSGFLTLMDTGSATGLRRTLNVAGASIINRGFVNTQDRAPIIPDDVILGDIEILEGQQVFIAVENVTAGVLTYRARVVIEQGDEVF